MVAGSHLSTPPVGPVLIAAAIGVGHFLLHGRWPALAHFDPGVMGYRVLLRSVLLEWVVGGVVCGAVLACIAFVITQLMLRFVPVRRGGVGGDRGEGRAEVPDRGVVKSAV